jgi:hypothetical protein
MAEMRPNGRTPTIHWGAVWTTGIFLVGLVGLLFALRLWVLGASMLGLTVGLGLMVAGQHRENEGGEGALYRQGGLAVLLLIGLAFFLSFLLRSGSG